MYCCCRSPEPEMIASRRPMRQVEIVLTLCRSGCTAGRRVRPGLPGQRAPADAPAGLACRTSSPAPMRSPARSSDRSGPPAMMPERLEAECHRQVDPGGRPRGTRLALRCAPARGIHSGAVGIPIRDARRGDSRLRNGVTESRLHRLALHRVLGHQAVGVAIDRGDGKYAAIETLPYRFPAWKLANCASVSFAPGGGRIGVPVLRERNDRRSTLAPRPFVDGHRRPGSPVARHASADRSVGAVRR